jgi:iron complex outermembrane recepter protein
MQRSATYCGRILTGALLLSCSAVYADDQAPTTGPGATASNALEEIIVTSRKRAESLLDVPASITSFSKEKLELQGVTSLTDLQNSVPNLQYSARGDLENQISIRGVGGDPRSVGIESGVGMYVDQVFVGRTGGYNQDLFNVSQIEVLRGPQGTVFGKNTTGGVINITTSKPTDEFRGEFSSSYGNYNAVVLKGDVSGPLTSNLYAGLTIATNTRTGYLENLYDDSKLDGIHRRGAKLQLRWLPLDNLEVNWSVDRTTNNTNFALTVPADPLTGPAIPYNTGDTRFTVSMDQSNSVQLATTGVSQVADLKLGGTTLTSVSGFRRTDILVFSDADGLPINVLNSGPFTDDSHMFTQEFRVTSPGTDRLRYVAGLYYFDQDATSFRDVYVGGVLANGYVTNSGVDTKAYAGYADLDFDLMSDLTASGGVRYTDEKKNGYDFQQGGGGKNYSFPDLRREDSDVSWSGSLTYHFDRNVSAYGTVSRGFKSGGFNVDPITVVANITPDKLSFAPETVLNYEVGTKGRFFDGALQLTAAVFRENFTNKQVAQIVPGANVISVFITNAGAARIQGYELEATLKPDPYWTIDASLSRLNAKYTSFANAASVNGEFVSYTGYQMENAPQASAALAVTRRQPFSYGTLIGWGSVRYTGDTYFQPDNDQVNEQKSYALVDARVGYETPDTRTSVYLWGKNLTDRAYFVYSRYEINIHQALYGDPRTFGIEATRKF